MENISLSQDELRLCMGAFNKVFQSGGISIQDANNLLVLAKKFNDKIKVEKAVSDAKKTKLN